jgi:hypothetical protein
MNSLKTPLLAIATAIAACSLAAGAIGATLTGFTPNLSGTPNDGMICRLGYAPSFNGTSLKCSKTSSIVVNLACADPAFPKYVVRALGSLGSPEGLDICITTNGVKVSSTDDISLLTKGGDYVFAKADQAKITEKTTARDLEEAAAIGGSASDVETEAGVPVPDKNSGGDSKDSAKVTLTHFSFAVKTGGPIIVGP